MRTSTDRSIGYRGQNPRCANRNHARAGGGTGGATKADVPLKPLDVDPLAERLGELGLRYDERRMGLSDFRRLFKEKSSG